MSGVARSMQLVTRIQKSTPPTRTDVCAAHAVATVTLLNDHRAQPGGPWHEQVTAWTDIAIHKHSRRGHPTAFRRASSEPGVTVTVGTATVRALVPGPVHDLPRSISRLQLAETELVDPDSNQVAIALPNGPVIISINPTSHLPIGKAAVAAGHAAQVALHTMSKQRLAAWARKGYPVDIEHPAPTRWAAMSRSAPVSIRDAGFTVDKPGTATAMARWA